MIQRYSVEDGPDTLFVEIEVPSDCSPNKARVLAANALWDKYPERKEQRKIDGISLLKGVRLSGPETSVETTVSPSSQCGDDEVPNKTGCSMFIVAYLILCVVLFIAAFIYSRNATDGSQNRQTLHTEPLSPLRRN